MDVTQDTVVANHLLDGDTATGANGMQLTGTLQVDVVVDPTLSNEGEAADAKATGDSISVQQKATDFQKIKYEYPGQSIIDNGGDGTTITLTPGASQTFNSTVVSCSEGEYFTITGTGGSSVRLWCFIDSNNVAIQTAKVSVSASNLILVAPKYAAKLILNNTNTEESYKGIVNKQNISDIKAIIKNAFGIEAIDFSNFTYCMYCATKPSALRPTQASNAYRYALTTCAAGDKFTICCSGGVSPRAYAFLDSGLNILSQAPESASYTNEIITAPTNAAWLILNDSTGTGYAFKGITPLAAV